MPALTERSKIPSRSRIGKIPAFTLVELIVVITILAILATVGFLTLSGFTDDARSATVAANVRTVYSAILTESTTSGNSPRYYVDHDPAAALSGGIVFVDGAPVALTGGQWGSGGTNYSAGNPRWDRLKMNGDKFRLSGVLRGFAGSAGFGGFADMAGATYDTGAVSVGAFDAAGKATLNGKPKAVSYFQVVGVSPSTKKASVTGNYMAAGTGAVLGLVDDPSSASSTGAIVDSATVNVPATPATPWPVCPTGASCSGNVAEFSASGSFTVQIAESGTYEILVVGGGGGGGSAYWGGGSGWAGGYAAKTTVALTSGQSYAITVGGGGGGGPAGNVDGYGSTGGTTSVGSLVSAAWGGGGASGGTQGNVQSTLTNTAGGTCGGRSGGGYDASSVKQAGCDGSAYYNAFDATVSHGIGGQPTNNYGAENDAGGGGGAGFGTVAKTVACPNGGTAATGHGAGGSGVGGDDSAVPCQTGASGYVRIRRL